MNRRRFIGSVLAFAALAAVPTTAKAGYRFLTTDETQRFLDMAKSGTVRNQTFLLNRPITIDFDNLIVDNCTFIQEYQGDEAMIKITKGRKRIMIINCFLEAKSGFAML